MIVSRPYRVLRIVLLMTIVIAGPVHAIDLTFMGWSDQHVTSGGSAEHCAPQIAAMNSMAGRSWPVEIGGTIATPSFIIGGGDITEWPSHAAKNTYNDIVTQQLIYPTFDVMGNHDFGGLSPVSTMTNWFIDRYQPPGAADGELSYSFDYDGVHFSMLDSKFDDTLVSPAQPITGQAIDWLKNDLAKISDTMPVIVVTHLCLDSITNKDEFVAAFESKNVVLVLGGHYHKPVLQTYEGYTFVQMPSPLSTNSIYGVDVFHITDDRLTGAVWNVNTHQWMTQYNLDLPISIPEPTSVCLMMICCGFIARRR